MIPVTPEYRTAINSAGRQLRSRIFIFHADDINFVEIDADDIINWELLSEARNDQKASGLLGAGEFTATISNKSGAYDFNGPNSAIYTIGNRIDVRFSIFTASGWEEIEIGEYYLTAFQIDDRTLRITGNDKLYLLMQETAPFARALYKPRYGDFFKAIFEAGGLTSNDYSITRTLNQAQKFLWFEEGRLADTLALAAEASRCLIYTSRMDNRIIVRPLVVDADAVLSLTDDNTIRRVRPVNSGQNYSRVRVYAYDYYSSGRQNIFQAEGAEIPNGGIFYGSLTTPKTPILRVNQATVSSEGESEVTEVGWSAYSVRLRVANPGPPDIADISVIGEYAESNRVEVNRTTGEQGNILTIDNHYLQLRRDAEQTASILSTLYKAGKQAEIEYTGDPSIELSDVLDINYRGETRTILPFYHSLSFDGSLRGTIKGFETGTPEIYVDSGKGQKFKINLSEGTL